MKYILVFKICLLCNILISQSLIDNISIADTCYCNLDGEYNAVTIPLTYHAGLIFPFCDSVSWEGKLRFESMGDEIYTIYSKYLDSVYYEDISMGIFYACYNTSDSSNLSGGDVRLINDCGFSYTGANQWGETYSILEYAFNEKDISIKWLSDYGESGHTILTPIDETPMSEYICDIIISNKAINHLENWTIHPNPVSKNTLLNIDLTLSESTNIEVVIIDVLGNIIYTQESKVNSGANRLDLSLDEFSAGIYLVKISDEKGQTVKKVIIN